MIGRRNGKRMKDNNKEMKIDVTFSAEITPEMLYAFYRYQTFRGNYKKPVVWCVLSALIIAVTIVFFCVWGFDPMMLAAGIVSAIMILTVVYLVFLSPRRKYRRAKKGGRGIPVTAEYRFQRYGFFASVTDGAGETARKCCDYRSLFFAAELGEYLCLCFCPDDALLFRKSDCAPEDYAALTDCIEKALSAPDPEEETGAGS